MRTSALRDFLFVVALATAFPASAQPAAPVALDFLAGDWLVESPAGVRVGTSHIRVQAAGAMLFEERTIGDGAPQPLWFANSERTGGWVQLFLNPGSQLREFVTLSPVGAWPLILGGDVALRDGRPAKFRLTISRIGREETRRLLEVSQDRSASWSTVLDYTYRRPPRG